VVPGVVAGLLFGTVRRCARAGLAVDSRAARAAAFAGVTSSGVLSVQVLGLVRAEIDGHVVEIGSTKQRLLLAVLAAAGGVVSRDRLIDALWGDAPPASADASLMGYVSRLRNVLGRTAIEGHPDGYRLRADDIDAAAFERLVDADAAMASLERALVLWRGDAFGDLGTHPFLLGEVRRLNELRTHTRLQLATALLDRGETARPTSMLEAIVSDEPLREDAWELLVRALIAGKREADAVRAAQRCRQALVEVGLDPSPRLVAAEHDALGRQAPPNDRSLSEEPFGRLNVGSIRYATNAGHHLAFQVVGGGLADVVMSSYGSISIDAIWDEPRYASFVAGVSQANRLILYDTRGIGLSDPIDVEVPPSIELLADDIIAVLDAARSTRGVLVGIGDSGPITLMAAHRHPTRVNGLVLINTFARLTTAPDYPIGVHADALTQALDSTTDPNSDRDTSLVLRNHAPSVADDPAFRAWWERSGRRGASPRTAKELGNVRYRADVRAVLATINVPTLILHRRENRLFPLAHGAYLATRIPNAQLIELEGADQPPFTYQADRVVDAINDFTTRHG
jgi:DNA-binding SARP family transcriptional activator/pimeloyl-ACP methyl ester carboxylesterase